MRKKNLKVSYAIQYKLKKPPRERPLACPLQKVYLNRISTLTSSMVLCPASPLKWILCSLRFTEKAKWSIYKTSKGESEAEIEEDRGEQNALDSWFNMEWDKYKHCLYQYHLVEFNTSPSSWKHLSLLSLSFLSALIAATWVCSRFPSLLFALLTFHFPHKFFLAFISPSLPLQRL